MSKVLNSQGQVIVEYILLLVVVVVVYITIMNTLVKRDASGDASNSGYIIQAWSTIIGAVSSDYADDSN